MFYNNVTVNGVTLKVAFVRTTENGLSVTGMTDSGEVMQVEFSFADNMRLVAEYKANKAPVKKERKPRKAKEQSEVAEVAPVVEMATDEQYAEYLTQRTAGKRGRAPKAIAAYIAAHNL